MIPLTIKEEIDHNKQKICYICKKEFDKKKYKVRDHCHYTGKYRVQLIIFVTYDIKYQKKFQ